MSRSIPDHRFRTRNETDDSWSRPVDTDVNDNIRTVHTWVMGSGRALCARIDLPSQGVARGALVLAPALGREAVAAFRTFRRLAVRAAESGFVTFSFAFSGTGDSQAVESDADLAVAWTEDLRAVISNARTIVGDLPVHLVGLRMGATIASQITRREDEKHILWEPVAGKSWLRQQQALRRLSIPQALEPDGTELCGLYFSDHQSRSIKRLSLSQSASSVEDPQKKIRVERDRAVFRLLTYGRREFTDPVVAFDAVEEILQVFPPGPWSPFRDPSVIRSTRTLGASGKPAFEETLVEVGPARLLGILTRPLGISPSTGVVFTAMGVDPMSGPGDLWAVAARELAASGVVSLRSDRRGLGEALDINRATEPPGYSDETVEDVADAVDLIKSLAKVDDVTGVGVCSGAWAFLNVARTRSLKGVICVNTIHWDPDSHVYDEDFWRRHFAAPAEDQLAAVEQSEVSVKVSGRPYFVAQTVRSFRHYISEQFPSLRAWVRGDRGLAKVEKLLGGVPVTTHVDLVMGTKELGAFQYMGGGSAVRNRAIAGGSTSVLTDPDIDHSLQGVSGRRALLKFLVQSVITASQIS